MSEALFESTLMDCINIIREFNQILAKTRDPLDRSCFTVETNGNIITVYFFSAILLRSDNGYKPDGLEQFLLNILSTFETSVEAMLVVATKR